MAGTSTQGGKTKITYAFINALLTNNIMSGVSNCTIGLLDDTSNISQSSDLWSEVTGKVNSGGIPSSGWTKPFTVSGTNPCKVYLTGNVTFTPTADVSAKYIAYVIAGHVVGYATLSTDGSPVTFEASVPVTLVPLNQGIVSLTVS